jgi:glycerol kinase
LICGLTFDAGVAHLARAALESVAYQTLDLTDAMATDAGGTSALRIDGGMAANDWLCQFLADMLQAPVERPAGVETTALGAAFLAGLAVGVWPDLDALADTWALDRRFEPHMAPIQRRRMVSGWRDAVRRTRLGSSVASEPSA